MDYGRYQVQDKYITCLTTKQRNQTILSLFRNKIFKYERLNDDAFAYEILVEKNSSERWKVDERWANENEANKSWIDAIF